MKNTVSVDLKKVRIYNGQGKLHSVDEMIAFLKYHLRDDLIGKVHIGTDAHKHGNKIEFVTAAAIVLTALFYQGSR